MDARRVEPAVQRQRRLIEGALRVGEAIGIRVRDDEVKVRTLRARARSAESRSATPALVAPRSRRLDPRNRLPYTSSGRSSQERVEQVRRVRIWNSHQCAKLAPVSAAISRSGRRAVRSRLRPHRLRQPIRVGATAPQPMTSVKGHDEFAMKRRLQLAHAVDVHHHRTVDPYKSRRIEPGLHGADRVPNADASSLPCAARGSAPRPGGNRCPPPARRRCGPTS